MADERGVVLFFTASILLVLLVLTAITVDIGYAKQYRREAQNSADAAALAAAAELDGTVGGATRAVAVAKTWARKNNPAITAATWQSCHDEKPLALKPDTAVDNTCISFSADRLSVRVRIPTQVQPAFFGRSVGRTGYDVQASARAGRTLGAATVTAGPCGLCVVGGNTLQITNGAKINVLGGEAQADNLTANTNGPATDIVPLPLRWWQSNNSNWGRNDANPSFASRYSKLAAQVPNPFAAVTVDYTGVTTDSTTNVNFNGNTCTGTSAAPLQVNRIYRQSVNIGSSARLCLAPGNYFFGGNLNVNSGATITGTGVTLIFSCPCSEGGKFNFSQGSTVSIAAPATGRYAGLSILFDPTNKTGTASQLSGKVTLTGALYSRYAGINSGSQQADVRTWTMVVGGRFDMNGGTFRIDNNAYYQALGGGTGNGSGAAGTGSVSLLE